MAAGDEVKANKTEPREEEGSATITPYVQGYLDAQLKKSKEELSELIKKEVGSQAKKQADKIKNDLQDYVSQNQTRVIEALAIFVALFTFIAVNIQIFDKVPDLFSATVFMTLMAFLSMILISFPIILLHSKKNDDKPKWVWWVFISSIILLLVLVVITSFLHIPLNVLSK
jgi:hypothetical protein